MVKTHAEIEDLADTMQDIYDEGIEVSMRTSDKYVLFAAVIAANACTYLVLAGVKKLVEKRRIKRQRETALYGMPIK